MSCIQALLGLQGKNVGHTITPGNALLGGFSFEGRVTLLLLNPGFDSGKISRVNMPWWQERATINHPGAVG